MKNRRHHLAFCVSCFLSCVLAAAAPETQPARKTGATPADAPWGERTADLQARFSLTGAPAVSSPLLIAAELKSSAVIDLPQKQIRLWLLVAQGADHIYYTEPYNATPKTIAAGETLSFAFQLM